MKDAWVVEVVTHGLRFQWLRTARLTRTPWFFRAPSRPEKLARLETEIRDLLQKRAIEEASGDVPAWYSLVFLVPKKNGSWRPVFDLSALNRHLVIPRFRMESSLTIMASLRKGHWVISIDVKDAYLHVPIHPHYRRFLHLAFQGRVY